MTARVLMTVDAVGGVWTYATDLAFALADHDVEVHFAVMGPAPTAAQRAELAHLPIASLHEAGFALEWMDDPWRDVDAAGEWLLSLHEQLRPDVVHLNGYVHAALPWPSPCVVVAHSDVVSWWRSVRRSAPPAAVDEYRRRVSDGLRAADAVIAPTAAARHDLATSFGFDAGRVIANGRRADWVRRTQKASLVATAGRRWDDAKNLRLVEQVAPGLPWPVEVLSGRPWSEVADLLLRASVYLSPARYEPFGLGALEAAMAGCALVLGDIPSLREVWGQAALYVDPDDADALAAHVRRLAAQPALVRDLAARATARAERYSVAAMGEAYSQLYRSLPVRTAAR